MIPRLSAWIDWNGDGDFLIRVSGSPQTKRLASGTNNLSVTVPPTAVANLITYARFRFGPTRQHSHGLGAGHPMARLRIT